MISFEEAQVRSEIIKALAHPVRIMIVEFLKEGEQPFSKIFELFSLDKSTVSKHLLVLKNAGILTSRKEGLDMIYILEVPCIVNFFGCVTAVAENNITRHQCCVHH